jgi:ABC-type transport system involved in Fe-S cluster assembly fused permease/ATPase subunit
MVYLLFVIDLIESKHSPTIAHWMSWILALVMEAILVAATLSIYAASHRELGADEPAAGGDTQEEMSGWEILEVIVDLARIFLLVALVTFYALFAMVWKSSKDKAESVNESEEYSPLLSDENRQTNGSAHADYGTHAQANGNAHGGKNTTAKGHDAAAAHPGSGEAPAGWEKPTSNPSVHWWEYIRAYRLFLPYVWPKNDRRLQVHFVICILIVFLQRVLMLLVPTQLGNITNILAGKDGAFGMPWIPIIVYVIYRLFQGGQGLLAACRTLLWIPIQQYSFRELSVACFEHIHQLSLEFHLNKKTGEVISALSKGDAVNTFLESVTFQMMPMLVDLIVAMAYTLYYFDSYYALVIAIVTFWYAYVTIHMASWRADARRQSQTASRAESAVKTDSIMSYEAVKYFNAEQFEFKRYREAVGKYQKAESTVVFSLAVLNTVQNLVFMLGLIIMSFIAAYQVTTKRLAVGDFITLLTYLALLQGPLNYFGTFFRQIQNALINTERMLELFKQEPTVIEEPDAINISTCKGEIRYNDVHFSYDVRKPALRGLSFTCKPGTTTAFVGESGGGKSTIFRLLFRFYNPQKGMLEVDGHDISSLTLDSLRRHIGVVPQDTVLFNESIMYNIRYARQTASDEEVYEACKAACIHERILSFPDGYSTKVGERGLRLSGGEKQRVAIARTILKDPRIILLDEATAALDTNTEEHIQSALQTLAQGRTMLIIAHRLSTITMCDQILVIHNGQVVEAGSHHELLADKSGRYASMWRKQVRAERAAHEAKVLSDKAERLRRESMNTRPRASNSSASAAAAANGSATAGAGSDVNHDHNRSNSSSDDEHSPGGAPEDDSGHSASSSTTLPNDPANALFTPSAPNFNNAPVTTNPSSTPANPASSSTVRSPSPVMEEQLSPTSTEPMAALTAQLPPSAAARSPIETTAVADDAAGAGGAAANAIGASVVELTTADVIAATPAAAAAAARGNDD